MDNWEETSSTVRKNLNIRDLASPDIASYHQPLLIMIARLKLAARGFSSSSLRRKDKNKDLLRKLGSILQKGKVGDGSEKGRTVTELDLDTPTEPLKSQELALDATVKNNIDELEDSYETLAFMTRDDVAIQENFDEGSQFGSFPSEHFLDRRALIRSLPDEIDILETPWEEIERIYLLLNKLDEDKAVHMKYMSRFGMDHKDLQAKLRLGSNLDDMCKAGRRGEKYEVPKGMERVFKRLYPYNVVGFDRSILGVPTRSGRHRIPDSEGFPQELITDVRPFDTKVLVHKVDVNFLEDDQLKESISPYDSKPMPPEDLLRDVGKPIFIDNIDNYRKVEHPSTPFLSKIEKETLLIKDSLYLEIARKMIPSGVDLVNFNAPKLRTNEFVVASKDHSATPASGPTTSYRFKYFDVIPVYGILLSTRKDWSTLYKHLFKVMLINLDEHIDVLTRIKYQLPEDAHDFLRKLYGKIHLVLRDVLMPMAVGCKLLVPPEYDAVVHKHILSNNFLRIYWMQYPRTGAGFGGRDYTSGVRRRSPKFSVLTLDPAQLRPRQ